MLALLDGDELTYEVGIDELARRVAVLVRRIHKLEQDFSVDLDDLSAVGRLLVRNPIEAFVNAKGTGGVRYFRFENEVFGFAFNPPIGSGFALLLREILDWRLAQYLLRGGGSDEVIICRVSRNTGGNPILFLPSGSRQLAEGPLELDVNGQRLEAAVAKIAINVIRDPVSGANLLPEILIGWFGQEAGLPGRSDRVRLRQGSDAMVMEPLGAAGQVGDGLRLWERYLTRGNLALRLASLSIRLLGTLVSSRSLHICFCS